MKIVIIGAGAMGCLYGGLLSRNPAADIWFLEKNTRTLKSIKKHGIRITGKTRMYIPPEKIKITNRAEKIGKCDVAALFVKSYNTEQAIKGISNSKSVITFQNGIGNLEKIARCLGAAKLKPKIFAAITSHAAMALSAGRIIHMGRGETIFSGYRKSDLPFLKELRLFFGAAEIETKISTNLQKLIWTKLAVNAAINPAGAIFNLTNGELATCEITNRIMLQAAAEVCSLANRKGIKLNRSKTLSKIISVCRATSKNKNSMLQDVIAGRKTEIESINGAVIANARRCGLNLPYNNFICACIRRSESKN